MVNNNILVYLFSIILIFKILIMQKSFLLFLVRFICSGMILLAQNNSGFHIITTFHIARPGGWDYIAVHPGNNRLYVSHSTQLNILEKTTGAPIGIIANTTQAHRIAF